MSRILVVEDDPAILRGLTDNLAFESHEVIAATDGETGYRLIREQKPDLILLDLMLPKLNGYDLCRRVRAEGFNTPIVMLTARGQEADRVLGLDLGADDYVSKPFSVRELLARIRAILRQRRVLLRDHGDFEEEVRVASDVQKRLFPQFQPLLATLDSVGICLPARGVSGDYYDFIDLSAGKLGMVVADVAGKGVSAALLVASLHACIRTHAPLLGDRCGEVVARVNALLYEATDTERFATLFYAVYDDATQTLIYVNAGHEQPLWIHRAAAESPARCERLDFGTPPLGIFPTIPAVQQSLQLAASDWLIIFSDGIPEALNEKEEEFGRDRLLEVVLRNGEESAAVMCEAILAEVRSHCCGQPPSDDVTLIVARIS